MTWFRILSRTREELDELNAGSGTGLPSLLASSPELFERLADHNTARGPNSFLANASLTRSLGPGEHQVSAMARYMGEAAQVWTIFSVVLQYGKPPIAKLLAPSR